MLGNHNKITRNLRLLAGLGLLSPVLITAWPNAAPTGVYIVQGHDLAAVAAAVRTAGGEITHELGIIRAVTARLTEAQRQALRSSSGIERIYENRTVTSAAKPVDDGTALEDTSHMTLIGADRLHAQGITGANVTLAVLDTGFFNQKSLSQNTRKKTRILAQYDALADAPLDQWQDTDGSGHGAHVASIGVNSAVSGETGQYRGVAPDANLVVVRAFDEEGKGSYADVIRGLDWLVAHKTAYGIRVLNLSFSAPPQSHYWDDPLNQAVMAAWQAGIVVVASAGNTGPAPMTVGVPGNVPYVITVGAMTDNHTPGDPTDDRLATFSSVGPTAEGLVKPEVVAPGGHVVALMSDSGRIAREHPEFHDGGIYFTMSGTSQAAAVVSGVAALLLQACLLYTSPSPRDRTRSRMPSSA